MLNFHFSLGQIIPLLVSACLLITSILSFKKSEKIGLTFLFIGAIALGYFASNLNHFLEIWDEQFHALVAKNMSKEPFSPKLFPEVVLPYQYTNWTNNYIWLHKQPLFLWQMALSIKLFGATEFAVRFPSIILHAIIPLFVYRIGKITLNKEIGFIAAVLITTSYFPLELITGRYATDHNDISFLFYVTGSFWAWFEYQRSKDFKYLIFIGLFSGCAVLVKWLMGLIIYVIWTITNLISYRLLFLKKAYSLPLIQASSISLLVFLPWQFYIHWRFPKEASYELNLNGQHFFNAIEGHSGDFTFHFTDGLSILYGSGDAVPFLLLTGLILAIQKCNNLNSRLFIGTSVVFTYLFFSFAATKMIAFPLTVMPFMYLGLATLIYFVIDFVALKLKVKAISIIGIPLLTILISFTALNLNRLENYHTNWKQNDNQNWAVKTKEKKFILQLKNLLNDGQHLVFNCNKAFFSNISIMFYTNHLAYIKTPSKQEIEHLKKKKKKIAVIDDGTLPIYILHDNSIKKIPSKEVKPKVN
ncbi:MAG: glycosyltransferase family 39 protein [Crocinitomicaceae bacterium]|nr:glycosyltransferase family 39 protein [Crocinitomicaceae bacterium]MDG1776880.1 glycosyltransferase family 39 protein [Crocinitomicaceae bacterium]